MIAPAIPTACAARVNPKPRVVAVEAVVAAAAAAEVVLGLVLALLLVLLLLLGVEVRDEIRSSKE